MKRLRRTVIVLTLLVVTAIAVPAAFTGFFGAFGADETSGPAEPAAESAVQGTQEAAPEATVDPAATAPKPGPRVAICVDDTGDLGAHMAEWESIDAPITFAVMPLQATNEAVISRLRAAGFEIILHIPEELDQPDNSLRITTAMDQAQVNATLDKMAATVPGMIGANYHQGSKAGNDIATQRRVVTWLQAHGYWFMDSMASTKPVGYKAAVEAGMPLRASNVFIDHDNDPAYIRGAMRKLADLARERGTAIGICHFARPNTARTVGEMIKVLEQEGITFDFVSNVSNQP